MISSLCCVDELFERLHDGAGTAQRVGAEACFDDLVLADVVDGQFVLLFDLDQEFAEFRIVKRLEPLLEEARGSYLLNLLLGWLS